MIDFKGHRFLKLTQFYGPAMELPQRISSDDIAAFLAGRDYFPQTSGIRQSRVIRFVADLETLERKELMYSTSVLGGMKARDISELHGANGKAAQKYIIFDTVRDPQTVGAHILVRARSDLADLFDTIVATSDEFMRQFRARVTTARANPQANAVGYVEGFDTSMRVNLDGHIEKAYPGPFTESSITAPAEDPMEISPPPRPASVGYLRLAVNNGPIRH